MSPGRRRPLQSSSGPNPATVRAIFRLFNITIAARNVTGNISTANITSWLAPGSTRAAQLTAVATAAAALTAVLDAALPPTGNGTNAMLSAAAIANFTATLVAVQKVLVNNLLPLTSQLLQNQRSVATFLAGTSVSALSSLVRLRRCDSLGIFPLAGVCFNVYLRVEYNQLPLRFFKFPLERALHGRWAGLIECQVAAAVANASGSSNLSSSSFFCSLLALEVRRIKISF